MNAVLKMVAVSSSAQTLTEAISVLVMLALSSEGTVSVQVDLTILLPFLLLYYDRYWWVF